MANGAWFFAQPSEDRFDQTLIYPPATWPFMGPVRDHFALLALSDAAGRLGQGPAAAVTTWFPHQGGRGRRYPAVPLR
jgi:hypothetical protein